MRRCTLQKYADNDVNAMNIKKKATLSSVQFFLVSEKKIRVTQKKIFLNYFSRFEPEQENRNFVHTLLFFSGLWFHIQNVEKHQK